MAALSWTNRRVTGALLACVLASVNASAQSTTGALQGHVTGIAAPVAGAEVVVSGADLPRPRISRLDSRGSFTLRGLPVGIYDVVIRLPGYRAVRHDSVVVHLGQTTTLPATALEPGEVTLAPLVVQGARQPIDLTSSSTGFVLSAALLRALPQERDVSSVLSMLPHHNASPYGDGINVAGSTGYENAHYVDGAHTTDPMLGRGSATLPYNFVREIQVRTAGYDAEFGRSAGGIVDILTHSGGDVYRAEGFGYFTNNRFAGERRVGALERAAEGYSYYDLGFSLGGPLVRDRAHVFLAYNPTFSQETVRVPSFSPQLDRRRQHLFAGKVTWLPTTGSTLLITVSGDPSTHDRVAPAIEITGAPAALESLDPVLGTLRQGGTTAAVVATHSTGDVHLQATLQRSSWKNQNAARHGPGELVTNGGVWSGGYGITINQRSFRSLAALGITLNRWNHVAKGGVELQTNTLDDFFAYGYPAGTGGYRFLWPGGYTSVVGGAVGRVRVRNVSAFVQDGWSVTSALRLNGGMRWNVESFVDPTGGTAQRLTGGWQPRLGVVFDPGRRGSEKLFATAGRYYQQLGTALASYQFAGTHQLIADHTADTVVTLFQLTGGTVAGDHGMSAPYFDEITVGYERLTTTGMRIGVRGLARSLREAVEDAITSDGAVVGNPGRGALSLLPDARREYRAIEITVDRLGRGAVEYAASYVLSSNRGNYPGAFDSDNGAELAAHFSPQFDDSLQLENADGLLPNDRTHVFKLFGAVRSTRGLTLGATALWQTGTPISAYRLVGTGRGFVRWPRGSLGRTPSELDLNVRVTWEPARGALSGTRLVADVFHVGSRRGVVLVDQDRLLSGGVLNPAFGQPIRFQSPMTVRLGVVIGT